MKKRYQKPEVYFEDFELSANIATGCEFKSNHWKDGCGYDLVGGRVVFLDGVQVCNVTPPPDGDKDAPFYGICYHVPTDTTNLFTS